MLNPRPKIENFNHAVDIVPITEEYGVVNRVWLVIYDDGWQDIFIDNIPVRYCSDAVRIAEQLLKAARLADQRSSVDARMDS